jgi:hypothetical protein
MRTATERIRHHTSVREEGIEAKHLVRTFLALSSPAREGIGVAHPLPRKIAIFGHYEQQADPRGEQ